MSAKAMLGRLRALLMAATLVCGWGAAGSATATTVVINSGNITKTINGKTTVDANAGLPYHWDRLNGEVDGQARFVAEVSVADPSQPLALYIPRLGNTFLITVNGHELERYGTLPPNLYDDAAIAPRYFTAPADWLTARTVIGVTLGVIGGRSGGLSPITTGPVSEVHRVYAVEYLLEVSSRRVMVVMTAVLSALAFLLWLRQRDTAYLYYALAEMFWTILTARNLISEPPLQWPWWWYATQGTFVLAVPLQCKFALMVVDRDRGWLRRFTLGMLVLGIPALVVHAVFGGKWIFPLWKCLLVLNALSMAWAVISANRRNPTLDHKVLGVAVVVVAIAALRDVWGTFAPQLFHDVSWTRFAWTGLGVSFAWVITERMRRASAALASMNATLSEQLAVQSTELAATYARERARDVEHGAMLERQRLTRDLHDGLGGHLAAVLRMTQLQSVSKEDVAAQLRSAVDQLKITVDALQETDGDIPSLLGAVRYRLTRRLSAAGIGLLWDVENLPAIENWGVRQSYELQMILFEVFTNMMVHSDASQATLCARQTESAGKDSIEIRITDNGKGFDPSGLKGGSGRGMANMAMRAASLGAELSTHSRPGETCTTIVLNGSLDTHPAPGPKRAAH